jgi:hypothetical protein
MVRAIARALLIALAVATAAGCKKDRDPAAELIGASRLAEAPALERSIRADLGGGVIYLGNEIDSKRARPGGSVTITHYLQITRAPETSDPLVLRVAGSERSVDQPASPLQQALPASRWKAGDIWRDRQVAEIPADWSEPSIGLRVTRGSIEAAVGRVAIEGGTGSTNDYAVHRSRGPIQLDGVASEPGWQEAAWSPRFTTAEGGRPVPGAARAKLLWDATHLYALIEVVDPEIFSPFSGRDDTLWKADVVEIFIDADRNRRGYVELQVNPRGAIFDAFFPVGRGHEAHFEWNSALRAAVEVDGTADKAGDRDRGWVVEMAIPHTDVVGMATDMAVNIPPRPGDRWNLNVVRVDQPGGSGISAATWNPITIRDFHALGRMLTVTFAD